MLKVNCHNLFDYAAGFGGYKQSGYGRDGGKEVRIVDPIALRMVRSDQVLIVSRALGLKLHPCTTFLPNFYPVDLQHSSCKHVLTIRVKKSVGPNLMA